MITISLGWWIAPAAITLLAFGWACAKEDRSPAYDYGRIGQGIGNAVLYGVALIVSLTAWLIWALLT